MRELITQNRKKRIILILGSVCAVLVVTGVMVHREAFAQRYQGKTVNQWLTFYVHESQSRTQTTVAAPDVIKAFGTNAVPALIKNIKPFYWFQKTVFVSVRIDNFLNKNVSKRLVRKPMKAASDRYVIAHTWGMDLLSDGRSGSLTENLLESHPDDNLVLLAVLFAEASSENSMNLMELYAKYGRNAKIRTRASRLLKCHNNWDEATYQKWLETQAKDMTAK
jgi:hypothetical protein